MTRVSEIGRGSTVDRHEPGGGDVRPVPRLDRLHRSRRLAGRALTHLSLIIVSVVFGYPLVWMVASSFKRPDDIFSIGLWPNHVTLQNYRTALDAVPLLRQLGNSVLISVTYSVGALLLCSAAGFAFAKLEFPARRMFFGGMVATMMIPNFMTLLPAFLIMSKLGWINTYQSVILPNIASAFGIFFMRSYMSAIPDEILDAARVDGASTFALYRRIALPLSWPAIGSLGILLFIGQWNSYLWPLVMLRTANVQTIVLGVSALPNSTFGTPWGAVMAGASIAIVPLLIVFFVFQRQIISGVISGSIKG
jgi:multiple sugar transport system permease protein